MAYPIYVLALAGVALYIIARRAASYIAAARFKKEHGCKPERRQPQVDGILGIGNYLNQQKAFKNNRLLDNSRERFEANGPTFSSTVLGLRLYHTIDPENIKAILATNFNDFGLGRRLKTFGDLLGKGIFTSDGAAWEHSRVGVP